MAAIQNLFTVDVEDFFQVSAFESHIPRDTWPDFPSRVEANTRRILRLLEAQRVPATFFILGWVASRFPQLVKDIHRDGHQVASHGFWHRLVYRQTPAEFRADIRASREVLEQTIGEPVTAYRAPSFSITARSLWALEILVEEGFTVDSSIFPVYHDRYGIPDAKPYAHAISTSSGPIWEIPPAVAKVAGLNIPVGGGYFRVYPWMVTRACLRRINARSKQPFMFYVHPWELDPQQPRLGVGSRANRFRHYVNLKTTEPKLRRLLQEFSFSPLRDALPAVPSHHNERTAAEHDLTTPLAHQPPACRCLGPTSTLP